MSMDNNLFERYKAIYGDLNFWYEPYEEQLVELSKKTPEEIKNNKRRTPMLLSAYMHIKKILMTPPIPFAYLSSKEKDEKLLHYKYFKTFESCCDGIKISNLCYLYQTMCEDDTELYNGFKELDDMCISRYKLFAR